MYKNYHSPQPRDNTCHEGVSSGSSCRWWPQPPLWWSIGSALPQWGSPPPPQVEEWFIAMLLTHIPCHPEVPAPPGLCAPWTHLWEQPVYRRWRVSSGKKYIAWSHGVLPLRCLLVLRWKYFYTHTYIYHSHFLEGDCKKTAEFVLEENSRFCSIFLVLASEIASSKTKTKKTKQPCNTQIWKTTQSKPADTISSNIYHSPESKILNSSTYQWQLIWFLFIIGLSFKEILLQLTVLRLADKYFSKKVIFFSSERSNLHY